MSEYDDNVEEWFEPITDEFKLCCCDCGLIHKVWFKTDNNTILMRMERDNRSTAQRRRHLKHNA